MDEIEKIFKSTTIVRVIDDRTRKGNCIFGDDYYIDRFNRNRSENQRDLKKLEDCWNSKWDSFNSWTKERQIYRFFYDDFKIFYYSFLQLKKIKNDLINRHGEELIHYNTLCGVSLYGLYNHGKKCIDLIKHLELNLGLSIEENSFIRKFSETRNKFFVHNVDPGGYSYLFEPVVWDLTSTSSCLDVNFHGKKEHEYTGKIDYYQDYYNLESILFKIISELK